MEKGFLVYVIGASGAGKDSLLQYARQRLDGQQSIVFAHRYITRPAEAIGENHVALSQAEFQFRKRKGLFALDWGSHGLHYGIGIEISAWLDTGLTVVVNGSREYLPEAQLRFPALRPFLIDVDTNVLRERLRKRGRETEAAIDERLKRAQAFDTLIYPDLVRIRNNGALQEAGEVLVSCLLSYGVMHVKNEGL